MDEKRREYTIRLLVDMRTDLDAVPADRRGRILSAIAAIRRDVIRRGATPTWHAIDAEAQSRCRATAKEYP